MASGASKGRTDEVAWDVASFPRFRPARRRAVSSAQRKLCLQPYTDTMSDTPTPDPTPAPEAEAGGDVSAPEGRPSRRATWLAMGAVAVALGLIWLAPGINDSHVDEGAGGVETDYPGRARRRHRRRARTRRCTSP